MLLTAITPNYFLYRTYSELYGFQSVLLLTRLSRIGFEPISLPFYEITAYNNNSRLLVNLDGHYVEFDRIRPFQFKQSACYNKIFPTI